MVLLMGLLTVPIEKFYPKRRTLRPVQRTSPPSTTAVSEPTSTVFRPSSLRSIWRTTAI